MSLFLDKRLLDLDTPLRQVKFVHLFKAAVLNLQEIIMKPEIQLIISAVRLYWS